MYYTTNLLLFVYYGYLPFTGLFAPFLLFLLRNNRPVVSHLPLFLSAVGRTLHPGELRGRLHWPSLDLEVELACGVLSVLRQAKVAGPRDLHRAFPIPAEGCVSELGSSALKPECSLVPLFKLWSVLCMLPVLGKCEIPGGSLYGTRAFSTLCPFRTDSADRSPLLVSL